MIVNSNSFDDHPGLLFDNFLAFYIALTIKFKINRTLISFHQNLQLTDRHSFGDFLQLQYLFTRITNLMDGFQV